MDFDVLCIKQSDPRTEEEEEEKEEEEELVS